MLQLRAGCMSADALSGIDKKHYPCSERSNKKKDRDSHPANSSIFNAVLESFDNLYDK